MVSNEDILDWYNERFNKPGFFSKKRRPVTMDTSLSTGRYVWACEAGDEIMEEYFGKFKVDPAGFDFVKYWPVEASGFSVFALCTCGNDEDEPLALTLNMLAESARAGKWLYQ